ncbi:hypothetical protein [Spirochaeta dissipatitropha]
MRTGGMLSAALFMIMLGSFISIESLSQRYSYLRYKSSGNSVVSELISTTSEIFMKYDIYELLGQNPEGLQKYITDDISIQFSDLSSHINPHWVSENFLYKYCTLLLEEGMTVEGFVEYRKQITPGLDIETDYAGWFTQEAFKYIFSPYSYPPQGAEDSYPLFNINTVNEKILLLIFSAHEETRGKKFELARKIRELQGNIAIDLSELHSILKINKQHELLELFSEHSNFWRLYVKKGKQNLQFILETVEQKNSIRIAGFRFLEDSSNEQL